jgi:hypothetical protein
MKVFFVHINIKLYFQNKISKISKIYASNNVYVQDVSY